MLVCAVCCWPRCSMPAGCRRSWPSQAPAVVAAPPTAAAHQAAAAHQHSSSSSRRRCTNSSSSSPGASSRALHSTYTISNRASRQSQRAVRLARQRLPPLLLPPQQPCPAPALQARARASAPWRAGCCCWAAAKRGACPAPAAAHHLVQPAAMCSAATAHPLAAACPAAWPRMRWRTCRAWRQPARWRRYARRAASRRSCGMLCLALRARRQPAAAGARCTTSSSRMLRRRSHPTLRCHASRHGR